jgi:hypothetical protein
MFFIRCKIRSAWGCFLIRIRAHFLTLPFLLCGLGALSLPAQIAQKPPAMGIPQNNSLVGDTAGLAREAQEWLVDWSKSMTNPPGNERLRQSHATSVLTKKE